MLISWNTTKACNLRCKHCYRDAGTKSENELSLEEARSLLREIKLAGFKILVLSGGEPLLREDIFEITSYARELNLRVVLGTNGTLITREVAERLKETGVARIGVSLDSKDPKLHDGFRGINGSFRKVLEGIDALKQVGLEFQIHTTVTKYNYKEIHSLIDFVIDLGAKAYHIFFLIPTGRGGKETHNIISPEEYYELISKILDRQKELDLELKPVCAPQFIPIAIKKGINTRFQKGCLAGTSYCCILPEGDVWPCPYLPLRLGNVREIPFSAIWSKNPILGKLRSLNYGGRCGTCRFRQLCGGCRARAQAYFNDYMGQDHYCHLNYG
jgi:putative heme d1 biosynthesis radical SAM protein NirJ2